MFLHTLVFFISNAYINPTVQKNLLPNKITYMVCQVSKLIYDFGKHIIYH